MNRITSLHLPRAKALAVAFRDEHRSNATGADAAKAEQRRQESPAGWPVPRARLAQQLLERLNGGSLPNQRGTSYCGCAAFLYCLLEDRPDWYVAFATALWRGEPFTFRSAQDHVSVTATRSTKDVLRRVQTGRTAATDISDLDWMTMASLSGATRFSDRLGPQDAGPSDRRTAITWPWMVKQWFASVGAPARHDSVGTGLRVATLDQLLELLTMWGDCWLVMEIDSSLLNGGGTSIQQRHWVVVDPETMPLIRPPGEVNGLTAAQLMAKRSSAARASVAGATDAYSGMAKLTSERERQQKNITASAIRLRVVSWANEHQPIFSPTLPFVLDRFYGGYAFPRFNRR